MKKIILLTIVFLISNYCFAQTNPSTTSKNIQWQKCLGGTKNDVGKDVLLNADGTMVIVGTSQSNDGDVTGHHGSLDVEDAWVAKIDASGNLLWQKSIGGTNYDEFNTIIPAGNGNYLCIGYTNSTDGDISFNNGGNDFLVAKIDPNGNVLWVKCYGGTQSETAVSGLLSSDGNYFIAGSTDSYDGDVQSKTFGSGDFDAWVIKTDTSGNIIWEQTVDTKDNNTSIYNYGFGIVENSNKTLTLLTNSVRHDTLSQILVGTGDPPETKYFYPNYYPAVLYQLNETNGQSSFLQALPYPATYADFASINDMNAFSICKTPTGNFYAIKSTMDGIFDYGYSDCKDTSLSIMGSTFYSFSAQIGCQQASHYPYYFNMQAYQFGAHGVSAVTDSISSAVGSYDQNYPNEYSSDPQRQLDAWLSKFGFFGGSYDDGFNSLKIYPNGNEFVAVGYTYSKDGNASGLHGTAGNASDCWIVKLANKNKINGSVYLDVNGNGKLDAGDQNFDNAKINVTRQGITQTLIPSQGNYSVTEDTGTYNVSIIINAPYFSANYPGRKVTFTSYGNSDTVNFR